MKKTVVLVHGAFHGAWCWSRVIAGLEARGIQAVAVDLPGRGESTKPPGGLREDAEAVREVLCPFREGVVLCGHSYGGAVITEAADERAPVDHLVYLAALVPDLGEGPGDAAPEMATAPISTALVTDPAGAVCFDPPCAREIFYHDCPPGVVEWAREQLVPERPEKFTERLSRAAWRQIPSTYVVCEQDRALDPVVQRRLARRCTRTVLWESSHSPMLSRPDLVAALLSDLASPRGSAGGRT